MLATPPFTQDEQRQIAAQLQEIRKQLREQLSEQYKLTSEQLEHIDERINEAAKASERLGRKDWIMVTYTLIMTATVPAGIGEHIFSMLVHALAHLIIGGSGPPQILT
jgi:chorismate synthase